MAISHEHKIIFIHVPKNAGTSIINIMNMNHGHHTWLETKQQHSTAWGKYIKFAVARNPWDRFVSNYEYAKLDKSYWHNTIDGSIHGKHFDYDICNKYSFGDIVKIYKEEPNRLKHQGWKHQHIYTHNNDSVFMLDKIFKYETLQSDFDKLKLNIKLPYTNKSKSDNYKQYYDDKSIEVIKFVYKTDIELFNYTF